jgi:hypothetical protein
VGCGFTEDGTFTDESIGVTWKGPAELPVQVENYHGAFPDKHRELYQVYVGGNIVVVQLALQGTCQDPAEYARRHAGTNWQPDGHTVLRRLQAGDGKIKRFDCYPSGTVILRQLGLIGNLSAGLVR